MKADIQRVTIEDLRARLRRLGHGDGRAVGRPDLLSDELRRDLRRRRPAAPSRPVQPAIQAGIVYRRDLPRVRPTPAASAGAGAGLATKIVLEEAVAGAEMEKGGGKAFVVCTRVDELEAGGALNSAFSECLNAADSPIRNRMATACRTAEVNLEDIIFMDIETTGLGCSPLFLVGVMTWGGEGFEVRQYLARHYAEEAAVISLFIEACRGRKLLVTFNGKSFDFPYVRTRAVANGILFDLDPAHLDLLHESRRIWRSRLPNCRLQTLERDVCGRARHGDIPGCEIPDAYHAYVRTGDAWQMVEVLKHNSLDLLTLADIMTRFPEG